jgi:hypothetical protein
MGADDALLIGFHLFEPLDVFRAVGTHPHPLVSVSTDKFPLFRAVIADQISTVSAVMLSFKVAEIDRAELTGHVDVVRHPESWTGV